MIKYFKILTLGIALSLASCSQESVAPQVTNVEGTLIHSGDLPPTLTLGKKGDFYIDLKEKKLYGPKTESSWGNGLLLNGDNGIDGTDGENGKDGQDGNGILNGRGVPTSGLGQIGDFYFDTENLAIYGPKATSGWGSPANLKPENTQNDKVRILLKENAKFYEEFTEFSNANDKEYTFRLNVGDISKYINEGTVLIQAKINNGTWHHDDVWIEQKWGTYTFDYSIDLENGYAYDGQYITIPLWIGRYHLINEDINDPAGIAEAKKWMDTLNVGFKITLIKADKVEKISRLLTGQTGIPKKHKNKEL